MKEYSKINDIYCYKILPYEEDGPPRDHVVALNRYYKPIGINTKYFVNYDNYKESCLLEETADLKNILSKYKNEKENIYYLYNDSCIPDNKI